ncbi:MAG: hypothetical protein WHV44_14745, partial [Anaerolineales bacterium]
GNPNLDLEVWAIEVTQGLQDLENRMPLVARRGTVIRVYVRTSGSVIHGVRGMLQIIQNGKNMGVVYAHNQPISAYADGGNRLDVDSTLNFYVPIDTRSGDVTYKVFAYPAYPEFPIQYETNAQNNLYEVSVKYHEGASITVVMPSIHIHMYNDNRVVKSLVMDYDFNKDALATRIGLDVMRYLPVSELVIVSQVAKIYPTDHIPDKHVNDWRLLKEEDAGNILAKIRKARDDSALNDDFWYGMVDALLPWGNVGGKSDGTVAFGKMMSTLNENAAWNVNGGNTAAHEGGHNYGLLHYYCSGNEAKGGKIDPEYPYPELDTEDGVNCSIAAVDPKGFYGFDWYYHLWPHLSEPTVISNDPAAPHPNRAFPIMGYKRPRWVDVYSYCKLLNAWGIPCNLADLGISAIPDSARVASLEMLFPPSKAAGVMPAYLADAGEFLRIYGVVHTEEDTASFSNIIRTGALTEKQTETILRQNEARASQPENATPYALTLEDSAGNILFSQMLYNLNYSDEEGNLAAFSFSEVLPFMPNTRAIRIRRGGDILTERLVSSNAPKVTLTSQNRGGPLQLPVEITWNGSDPDGNRLTYSLQYSPDDGQTWIALIDELTTTSVILESFNGMPGSDNGRFRVIANDGVNTAADTNDTAFSIPDGPPVSLIFSPTNAAVVPEGGAVFLTGQSLDLEDGPLDGPSMTWTSDIDGRLGSGRELAAYALSPGLHQITLTAADSRGQTGSAAIYINVDPNTRIAVPNQQEIDTVTSYLNGNLPQS